jgi:flagellar biosynthesis protein FlhG
MAVSKTEWTRTNWHDRIAAVLKELNREKDNMAQGTAIKMISNRVSDEKDGEILYRKLNGVVQMYLDINYEYIGSVVSDANLSKSIINQQPISTMYPNSAAVKSIRKLALNILNEEEKVQPKGISGMFTQFLFGSLVSKKGETTGGIR